MAQVYSLWLCPPFELSLKLRKIISECSQIHKSAAFEPHITLMHSIVDPKAMIMNKIEELCNKIEPFKISLKKQISFGNSFYQSAYILVELTPSLITANSICRNLFRRFDDSKYMPHLSLLYCDPNKMKNQQIVDNFNVDFGDTSEFIIDSVELWSTSPQKNKIIEWEMVKTFYFNKNKYKLYNINNNNNNINNCNKYTFDQFDDDEFKKESFAKDWGNKQLASNSNSPSNLHQQLIIKQKHDKITSNVNTTNNKHNNNSNGRKIIQLIDEILLQIS